MCIQALPLLLSAGGAAIQQAGQNQSARDQDQELARNIRTQNERGRQGSQRVTDEILRVSKSNAEPERAAAQAQFLQALKTARAKDGGDGFDQVGNVSDRFAEDVGTARGASAAEGANTAGLLARIDAPVQQRVREGAGFNRTATDLSLINGRAQGEDFLSQLRRSLITPRGAEIGGLLSGLGSTMATRAPPVKKPSLFSQLPNQSPFAGAVS